MAFTVGDFHDLVRLLEEHPEWRTELRRLVLTEDVLGLPAALHQLAEAQVRTEERVAGLETVVRELGAAQVRTEAQLGQLVERVDQLAERVDQLAQSVGQRLDRAESNIGRLRGWELESRYRERAAGYFRRVVRRPMSLSAQQLADLVDAPEAVGRLSEDEREDVLLADLVVRGRPESGEGDVYLVVEVSAGIGKYDVERAAQRAELLGRVHATLAVVAGEWITEDAERLAVARGVWRVLDGQARPPEVRAG